AMIDQHTLGFRFIKSELKKCSQPSVAWQLDLFGHSREVNSLFSQMGYDGVMFGRLDYQEKVQRIAKARLQMLWKVNDNTGIISVQKYNDNKYHKNSIFLLANEQRLFTTVLPNLYHPPEGFNIGPQIAGQLIREDDADTMEQSASAYSHRLLIELETQQRMYKTQNIALIYGGDFEYEGGLYKS
ncbi:unnamed protein product, partial [Didymodactylos carnosus]